MSRYLHSFEWLYPDYFCEAGDVDFFLLLEVDSGEEGDGQAYRIPQRRSAGERTGQTLLEKVLNCKTQTGVSSRSVRPWLESISVLQESTLQS